MDSAVRRADLAVPAGMFDVLDSKLFAAASVAAITAVLCYVSGVGGDIGLLVIPPLVALIYWLMFR
jgi:p-aminobenzoyl-glutamate transporter AbgT